MTELRFEAAPVLRRLKDFQRRTVDYVFDQLFRPDGAGRFLVADEVGLGKTLVAKGVIARALEYLQDRVERVDIIYVCSNAAIATQNVDRLNVTGNQKFAMASRLTLLPLHVHNLKCNKVNFVSFTPGTTFDLKSRGGTAEERALIYRMLRGTAWGACEGLLNLLQGTARNRDHWKERAMEWAMTIDRELAREFVTAVVNDMSLCGQLDDGCSRFQAYRQQVPKPDNELRYEIIGELRDCLGRTCLAALQPDLVILDEFQRFRNLLDGDDQGARLARDLFNYPDVRTLLLSATPYKMLSLDHEQDDDHYPELLRTLGFLLKEDTNRVDDIGRRIQDYRRGLLSLADGRNDAIVSARDRLQAALLKVMCRTERVGMTRQHDAMLVEPPRPAALLPSDLEHARIADRTARSVGAPDILDYWKSSPYLLNFLKHYDFRRRVDAVQKEPPSDLLAALGSAGDAILRKRQFDDYRPIKAGNARMRVLYADTLDKDLWRLLWLPPSLPYTAPAGAYAGIGAVTKALVFSSWNLIPDAIAAVVSYEAERRMVTGWDKTIKHDALYDRIKPLLRFQKGPKDRLNGMPVVAWMLPAVTLARAIDPLQEARSVSAQGGMLTREALLARAERVMEKLLDQLPPGDPAVRIDMRWYWAAPAMLDVGMGLQDWLESPEGWGSSDDGRVMGEAFREHLAYMTAVCRGEVRLGPRPPDLPRVLAELALAGPGVCALRSLRRIVPGLPPDDPNMLSAAAHIASGFRTLFNLPETIALLRGSGEDTYWRLVLDYSLDGNLQALLDEQVHVLVEQLGLADACDVKRASGVAEALAEALSIQAVPLSIDTLRPWRGTVRCEPFKTRCRFALRFGDLRDDRDATIARAGTVRAAFNSPFRPFVLASTSIGQEGLDFHTWCHAVVHWNLPSNPVDLEQREGRVHRYKGHAVRKNIAAHYGLAALAGWDGRGDPWQALFERAGADRAENSSDLIPFWVFEQGPARVERRVPLIPFSREVRHLDRLKRGLALYRLVFGQPRQEDLLAYLADHLPTDDLDRQVDRLRINLEPPGRSRNLQHKENE